MYTEDRGYNIVIDGELVKVSYEEYLEHLRYENDQLLKSALKMYNEAFNR